MATFKQLLLLFFFGLGIQRLVQDAFRWIDPELVARNEADYFSVAVIVIVYAVVRRLKQRDAAQPVKNETTN